jgi:hypothetical protein
MFCQCPNSPLDLMSLSPQEIETRLLQLRATRDSVLKTYERLVRDKEHLTEEMEDLLVQLEKAESLELEEFRRKIPTISQ